LGIKSDEAYIIVRALICRTYQYYRSRILLRLYESCTRTSGFYSVMWTYRDRHKVRKTPIFRHSA